MKYVTKTSPKQEKILTQTVVSGTEVSVTNVLPPPFLGTTVKCQKCFIQYILMSGA